MEPSNDPTSQLDCEQAERLIARQVANGLPGGVIVVLRRHLAVCDECRSSYRARVEALAHVGRQARLGRSVAGAGHPAGVGAAHHRSRIRSRSIRGFVMLVVPAALFFLATRLDASWDFEPPLTVQAIEGAAWVGSQGLDASMGTLKLRRSDVVATEPDGRVRIGSKDFEVDVEPEARVLVISALTKRVRLEEGTIVARGHLSLETPLGMIELTDAEARVRIDGSGLDVSALRGTVERIDAAGRRSVPVLDGSAAADG